MAYKPAKKAYKPEQSVSRLYSLLFWGVFGIIIFVVAKLELHRSWLLKLETKILMEEWAHRDYVDTLVEYAPLPGYERYLIDKQCKPIYDKSILLVGTKERLDPSNEPACQALIAGGWQPNWSVRKYLTWRDKQSRTQ